MKLLEHSREVRRLADEKFAAKEAALEMEPSPRARGETPPAGPWTPRSSPNARKCSKSSSRDEDKIETLPPHVVVIIHVSIAAFLETVANNSQLLHSSAMSACPARLFFCGERDLPSLCDARGVTHVVSVGWPPPEDPTEVRARENALGILFGTLFGNARV